MNIMVIAYKNCICIWMLGKRKECIIKIITTIIMSFIYVIHKKTNNYITVYLVRIHSFTYGIRVCSLQYNGMVPTIRVV